MAAIRGIGEASNQLRVAAIALTIGGVILAELLGVALLINKALGAVRPSLAVELYSDSPRRGMSKLALGAAAVGSWAALSLTRE
jgi:hypothetical protein